MVRVCRINDDVEFAHERLPLPRYETAGAAGMDLRARLAVVLQPGEAVLIWTGVAMEIPPGYEGQVRGRGSLARKGVLAHVGTVDSDYRGEIGVVLFNLGREEYTIYRGDRVGQLVVAPVAKVELEEVLLLEETARGSGGFGSTGR